MNEKRTSMIIIFVFTIISFISAFGVFMLDLDSVLHIIGKTAFFIIYIMSLVPIAIHLKYIRVGIKKGYFPKGFKL